MTDHNTTALAERILVVHTDGSCHGNPGHGGWATVADYPDGTRKERSGHMPETTNNRAELVAIKEALKLAEDGASVLIKADSQYGIKGATEWMPDKWKKNGWRGAKKKPVANRDLWEEIDALMETRKVTFEHVSAHTGVEANERADALANAAALGEVVG